ncbi:hypothetical protein D3C72_1992850 [compost metagenome]
MAPDRELLCSIYLYKFIGLWFLIYQFVYMYTGIRFQLEHKVLPGIYLAAAAYSLRWFGPDVPGLRFAQVFRYPHRTLYRGAPVAGKKAYAHAEQTQV